MVYWMHKGLLSPQGLVRIQLPVPNVQIVLNERLTERIFRV
ncbi:hypothetical protein PHB09_026 [Pseudomonas phage PHB09]|uniref:Uncharacterized protein n=1 Tax=Pseudomonas phage PHB09 TaxID=2867265 RepID=A0AAE8XDX3_9CAUD|nr:hypothetical protein QGX10_gp026 [Pseudomonas phage PHB09]UAV84522.1 hypothetical protein PHB09_026 [Pseudomonas phage PHB09]